MMQQFAINKPDSAAASLPSDVSGSNSAAAQDQKHLFEQAFSMFGEQNKPFSRSQVSFDNWQNTQVVAPSRGTTQRQSSANNQHSFQTNPQSNAQTTAQTTVQRDRALERQDRVQERQAMRPSASEVQNSRQSERDDKLRESKDIKNQSSDEYKARMNQKESRQQGNEAKASNENTMPSADERSQLDVKENDNNNSTRSSFGDNSAATTENKAADTNEQALLNNTNGDNKYNEEIVDESKLNSSQSEFDYVDYVTQFAELETDSKINLASTTDLSTNNADLLAVQEDASGLKAQLPDDLIQLDIPLVSGDDALESLNEFVQINISQEDLQAILDARNIDMDLSASLSDEELSKLENIISSMLTQLDTTEKNSGQISEENLNADHSLLMSLLLNQKATSEVSTKANGSEKLDDSKFDISAKAQILNTQVGQGASEKGSLESGNTEGLLSEEIHSSQDAKLTEKQDAKATDQQIKQTILANESRIKQMNAMPFSEETASSANAIGDKTAKSVIDPETFAQIQTAIESNSSKAMVKDKTLEAQLAALIDFAKKEGPTNAPELNKNSQAKTAIDNMLALSEAQSQAASENLTQKLQNIVTDLKSDGKGNEFIAALQSGLKEFKQQLSQGREPGIDLKALVSEALVKANVEVSASAQPKIDQTVNQLNSVLNLASAVNSALSLQNNSAEQQILKDFSLQSIEGTKLASATTQQQNTQASADKAMNILKLEGQQQMAEKIRWMVNSKNSSAEIRLDPPDLGGVNIKIHMSGDSAQVSFNVQNSAAKDVLDQAIPRLRDMLNEQGIELGQSNVQQESSGDNQGSKDQEMSGNGSIGFGADQNEDAIEAGTKVIEQRINSASLSGIDFYA